MNLALTLGNSPSQYLSTLIHSIPLASLKFSSVLIGILFSDWQASTQAWQPVHLSISTAIPHLNLLCFSATINDHLSL